MRFGEVFLGLCCLSLAQQICAQWQIQDAHTTASLRGIHYVGNGVAWASGTDGTVLRTEDMGFVWQLCSIPPGAEKLDFRGIQAFDNNTAIVMSSGKGDLSRLYKTTDGCQTWKLVFTNPESDGFWDAIRFDRQKDGAIHGWILGDPVSGHFRVFQTTDVEGTKFKTDVAETLATPPDGGAVFAASNSSFTELREGPAVPVGPPLPPPPPGEKRKEHHEMWKAPVQWFVTGGHGGARVYVRGPEQMFDMRLAASWTTHALPLGSGTEASGAFSIGVRDWTHGVIVGGDYSKANESGRTAAYRDPNQKAWLAASSMPHGYRSAVAYDTRVKGWITVGPNGTDLSTDDGRNWHPLEPGPSDAPDADQHWNALSLPFVVGPKGRIGLLRESALPTKPGKPK